MSANPYRAPAAEPSSSLADAWGYAQVRSAARLAWLCFFLISGVGGMIAGGVIGAVLGGALSVSGWQVEEIQLITFITGVVVGIPISYLVFIWSLRRFVLPACATVSTPEAPPSPTPVP